METLQTVLSTRQATRNVCQRLGLCLSTAKRITDLYLSNGLLETSGRGHKIPEFEIVDLVKVLIGILSNNSPCMAIKGYWKYYALENTGFDPIRFREIQKHRLPGIDPDESEFSPNPNFYPAEIVREFLPQDIYRLDWFLYYAIANQNWRDHGLDEIAFVINRQWPEAICYFQGQEFRFVPPGDSKQDQSVADSTCGFSTMMVNRSLFEEIASWRSENQKVEEKKPVSKRFGKRASNSDPGGHHLKQTDRHSWTGAAV